MNKLNYSKANENVANVRCFSLRGVTSVTQIWGVLDFLSKMAAAPTLLLCIFQVTVGLGSDIIISDFLAKLSVTQALTPLFKSKYILDM